MMLAPPPLPLHRCYINNILSLPEVMYLLYERHGYRREEPETTK